MRARDSPQQACRVSVSLILSLSLSLFLGARTGSAQVADSGANSSSSAKGDHLRAVGVHARLY